MNALNFFILLDKDLGEIFVRKDSVDTIASTDSGSVVHLRTGQVFYALEKPAAILEAIK